MTISEWLSEVINKNYKSQTEFARLAGIPLTTLRSILSRDFGGTSIENALAICEALGIHPNSLSQENFPKFLAMQGFDESNPEYPIPHPGSDGAPLSETIVMTAFRELNPDGQRKVIEYADDLVSSGKYKKGSETAKNDEPLEEVD